VSMQAKPATISNIRPTPNNGRCRGSGTLHAVLQL
jgi:hypothetical protein